MSEVEPIEAFYGMSSPWAYFGAGRLFDIAERTHTPLVLRPIRIVTENGGIPLRTRPVPRQEYHAVELKRWSRFLGIPLNLEPRFYPCRTIEIAACAVIAVARAGLDERAFSFAIQRALWAEDRDIADVATLCDIARDTVGEAGVALVSEPPAAEAWAEWSRNLEDAKRLGIFGTPTYVYGGELFWGQDRLDFLEAAIRERRNLPLKLAE